MKLASLVLFLVAALVLGGCGGNSTSSICARALECKVIGSDDVSECESDISKAVSDGTVTEAQVSACDKCSHANSCGADILIDCANDCPTALTAVIIGANIH